MREFFTNIGGETVTKCEHYKSIKIGSKECKECPHNENPGEIGGIDEKEGHFVNCNFLENFANYEKCEQCGEPIIPFHMANRMETEKISLPGIFFQVLEKRFITPRPNYRNICERCYKKEFELIAKEEIQNKPPFNINEAAKNFEFKYVGGNLTSGNILKNPFPDGNLKEAFEAHSDEVKQTITDVIEWVKKGEEIGLTDSILCPECGAEFFYSDTQFSGDNEARMDETLVCNSCGCNFIAEKYESFLTYPRKNAK